MKKLAFLTMLTFAVTVMNAAEATIVPDSLCSEERASCHRSLPSLDSTYMYRICEGGDWRSNWFVEMRGGASIFLGSPFGHGTVLDHTTPVLQVGIGKWFTPDAGGRIVYQGLHFTNASLEKMHYQFFHADFLWNVTGMMDKRAKGFSGLDFIPFAGVGIIRNADWERVCKCSGSVSSSHPFAFSYGVQVRYPICPRLDLSVEVSGMTTLKNFDRVNLSEDFGDHMLSISAGLSLTLGKSGWRKVLDARPYVLRHDLMEEVVLLRKQTNHTPPAK